MTVSVPRSKCFCSTFETSVSLISIGALGGLGLRAIPKWTELCDLPSKMSPKAKKRYKLEFLEFPPENTEILPNLHMEIVGPPNSDSKSTPMLIKHEKGSTDKNEYSRKMRMVPYLSNT